MDEKESTWWCVPDGCPVVICGGPHILYVNAAGDKLLVGPAGKPLPGYEVAGPGVAWKD